MLKKTTFMHFTQLHTSAAVFSIIMLVACYAMSSSVYAQTSQSTAWSKTYPGFGELSKTVIQTADGGYALLCTNYNFGNPDYASGKFYLLKLDSTGNQQWNSSYIGSIFDIDSGQYLIQTSDGGYASIAEYQHKVFLIKIDSTGKEQWNQSYTQSGTCIPGAIIQTSDGGYAILAESNYYIGPSYPPPTYTNTVWLIKTDTSGTLQWSNTYGLGDANSLIQTSDGGFAIGGQTQNPNSYYLLIKTDPNGTQEWNKTFVHQDENFLCTIAQTNDNGYALGGWIWLRTNGGGPNMAITKTDSSGNEEWTNYYGAGATFSMTKTNDGGYALAGNRLVKVDNAGNQQWTISLSGQPSCIIQTSDGGYVLSGYSNINTTATGPWLTKIDVTNPNQTAQPSSTSSSTPTPTNAVPEYTASVIVPLLLFMFVVAVTVKYQKTLKLEHKKETQVAKKYSLNVSKRMDKEKEKL